MAVEGTKLTFFEKTQETCCSKPALGISVIVALAVAIIGSLALAGILYPHTPLAALGNAIGQIGSIVMLSSGGTAALLILVVSICCARNSQIQSTEIHAVREQFLPGHTPPGNPGGGDTGAAGGPGDRPNVSFI